MHTHHDAITDVDTDPTTDADTTEGPQPDVPTPEVLEIVASTSQDAARESSSQGALAQLHQELKQSL